MEKKWHWCYQELLKEWDKQVFQEGTDYEGSTAYHRLVTEIFYLFYLLCSQNNRELPGHYKEKLRKMFCFIEWCTPHKGSMITIGDDDSGKILYFGLSESLLFFKTCTRLNNTHTVIKKHYQNFGLSVLKTRQWHCSLRHHAYQYTQPSGHYHADVGSVTLAYRNVALFVDGGSYLYTPSLYWRNYFRSSQNHNTFFLQDQDFITLDSNFFMLALPESRWSTPETYSEYSIRMHHDLYKRDDLQAVREINLNEINNYITIVDRWQPLHSEKMCARNNKELLTCWNFIINPALEVQQYDDRIELLFQGKLHATIISESLKLGICDAWIAPMYGEKKKTRKIFAQKNMILSEKSTLVIQGAENI